MIPTMQNVLPKTQLRVVGWQGQTATSQNRVETETLTRTT